ncbi:MAG: Elongation factor P [Alphaproteobacteria bacterium MarineAlpha9_Bin2]|nr:MAG: Elongation factor P [Alphaproteobacteria bacterium MarineAlpha9_Bin1]PPR31163.1 MAG: Elongation factor P [Alphaproteobacteria bacterium MarineAlpha9_Bin2]
MKVYVLEQLPEIFVVRVDMKINGSSIRSGNIILHQGTNWRAIKCQAVKPGKGGAFNQVELRNLENGSKLNERFRANEVVEKLSITTKTYQFLYGSGNILTFMNTETYDQIELSKSLIGDQKFFLQDGMEVSLEIVEEKPVGISLPEQVVQEVLETEAVVKGQTASSSYKPAMVDNGLRIMVPSHIEVGVKIIVSTIDCTYVGKYKS